MSAGADGVSPSKQILVIEDHRVQRELMCHVLEPLGFEITQAEDGRVGIAHLEKQEFAVIILDLQTPGGRGESVIQWILTNRNYMRSRVLVVSGAVSSSDEISLGELAVPVLAKPYLIADLVQAVTKIAAAARSSS